MTCEIDPGDGGTRRGNALVPDSNDQVAALPSAEIPICVRDGNQIRQPGFEPSRVDALSVNGRDRIVATGRGVNRDYIEFGLALDHNKAFDEVLVKWRMLEDIVPIDLECLVWTEASNKEPGYRACLLRRQADGDFLTEPHVVRERIVNVDRSPVIACPVRYRRLKSRPNLPYCARCTPIQNFATEPKKVLMAIMTLLEKDAVPVHRSFAEGQPRLGAVP